MEAMLSGIKNARLSYNSVTLVMLLLLSSWSAALTAAETPVNTAESDVTWDKSGSVDSGWMRLTTSEGTDPTVVTQAYADWNLEFAPGAEVSNVTLQVHVNGSDGLVIDSPLLLAQDTGDRLFDFSGYGNLGALDSFDRFNPCNRHNRIPSQLQNQPRFNRRLMCPSSTTCYEELAEEWSPLRKGAPVAIDLV